MAEDDDTKKNFGDVPIITSEVINAVPVRITAILGSATVPISQVLKFRRGTVVELNRRVSEPVDLYINDKLIARGEVVIVDQSVGISLTEVVKN